jgi:hypothetical protein
MAAYVDLFNPISYIRITLRQSPIGIGFLLALFLPILSTVGYLHLEKHRIKKAVKWKIIEGIDKDELVLLRFTEETAQGALRWEHDREFEYQNEMYDVVETDVRGDTLYYWCWWDHEETALNRQLSRLVSRIFGQPLQNQDPREQLTRFFEKLFCSSTSSPLPTTKMAAVIPLFRKGFVSFSPFPPPTPPPKSL